MKTSSARQLQFNLEHSGSAGDRRAGESPVLDAESAAPQADQSAGAAAFPHTEAFAVTARIAGRINAASIPQAEYDAALAERRKLLDKKLGIGLTPKEENRLKYVRWTLDRIEDARDGHVLDMLESALERYEQFNAEIQGLRAQLDQLAKRQK